MDAEFHSLLTDAAAADPARGGEIRASLGSVHPDRGQAEAAREEAVGFVERPVSDASFPISAAEAAPPLDGTGWRVMVLPANRQYPYREVVPPDPRDMTREEAALAAAEMAAAGVVKDGWTFSAGS